MTVDHVGHTNCGEQESNCQPFRQRTSHWNHQTVDSQFLNLAPSAIKVDTHMNNVPIYVESRGDNIHYYIYFFSILVY